MINKNEDVKRLVNQAVALDKEQRECKRKLDMVKAKLQSMGLEVIEERNVKYIQVLCGRWFRGSWRQFQDGCPETG